MNLLKILKYTFIKSQFYVSLCSSLLGIFILEEQESYHFIKAVVLFLTFWNGYLFTVFHQKKNTIWINWIGFLIITIIILKNLILGFYVKWLVVLIFGFMYNANFLKINLREFSLIKTFYVGFVWAASLVWLPLETFNWRWFMMIFFFTSAITFPFEIRDLGRDNFPTLPQKIGINNTKYLSYFFLSASSCIAFITLENKHLSAFSATLFMAAILVSFTNKKRQDWYYSFLIESLSTIPFLILILLK